MNIPVIELETDVAGTRVYQAVYAEPYEDHLYIGSFWTPEAARDACIAWYESSGSWTCHTCLRVLTRVVQG